MPEIKFVQDLDPLMLLAEAVQLQAGNLIQVSSPDMDGELLTTEIFNKDPNFFMKFPLTSVLTPTEHYNPQESTHNFFTIPFTEIGEKQTLLNQMETTMGTLGVRTSLATSIGLVCDELFTNAVYNASYVTERDYTGYIQRDGTRVHMKNPHHACMSFGATEDRLVLACWDSCGSLNIERYLKSVLRCYQQGAQNAMNLGRTGGAGIGSYFIFDACMSLYILVEKGKQTLIAVSFPKKFSKKLREKPFKNLHFRIF